MIDRPTVENLVLEAIAVMSGVTVDGLTPEVELYTEQGILTDSVGLIAMATEIETNVEERLGLSIVLKEGGDFNTEEGSLIFRTVGSLLNKVIDLVQEARNADTQ